MCGINLIKLSIFLYAVLSVLPIDSAIQDDIKYISKYLGVKYEVITNVINDSTLECRVTLTNHGRNGVSIQKGQWEIYFNNFYMVEPKHLFMQGNDGYEIPGAQMKVLHVNGGLFKFVPTDDFKEINPGESLELNFQVLHWVSARADVLPNWYVADSTGSYASILSTQTEHLTSFTGDWDTQEKWKRSSKDVYNPWTSSERWERYNIKDLGKSPKSVIPTPQSETKQKGEIKKPLKDWVVYYSDESLQSEANILREKFGWKISTTTEPSENYVKLVIDSESSSKDEGYDLKIESKRIVITSPSDSGIFYGIQTLISILEDDTDSVQLRTIKDLPRYDYRGVQVDVSRHFVSKEDMLKLIKTMGMYKLNKLHFHLSDDDGWRIEMPWCSYLTSIGARRCHDLTENYCLLPQLGSGPEGKNKGSGYYTADQYKEILSSAADNHIEVIPEIDMPGHARAAIKATEAYLKAAKNGSPGLSVKEAEFIQLSDPDDESFYHSTQLYTDNAINPCIDSSYKFVEMVVSQLVEYHRDIQPLKTMHIGGDEVAKGAWVNSSRCIQLLKKNPALIDAEDLMEYFVQRVSEIVAKIDKNLILGLWEDGAITSNEEPFDKSKLGTKNVLVNSWQNVWEWGVANRAYKLANAGYKIVMSQATHTYFDHSYEPDPEERGLYWATRFIDTKKAFGFLPDDLYANAKTTRFGKAYTEEMMCESEDSETECTPLKSSENIIGIQGHMWTETTRTSDHFFGNAFPRLLALAERAWHKAPWENEGGKNGFMDDWTDFANTVGYKELRRLDNLGVAYRVPVAGSRMFYGLLELNCEFPGLEIIYSSAENPFRWSKYVNPVEITSDTYVQVRSSDDTRGGRVIRMLHSPSSSYLSSFHSLEPYPFYYLFVFLFFALCLS